MVYFVSPKLYSPPLWLGRRRGLCSPGKPFQSLFARWLRPGGLLSPGSGVYSSLCYLPYCRILPALSITVRIGYSTEAAGVGYTQVLFWSSCLGGLGMGGKLLFIQGESSSFEYSFSTIPVNVWVTIRVEWP